MAELPTADATEIPTKLNGFTQRMQEIAITSGGSSATSSYGPDARDRGVWLKVVCRLVAPDEWPPRRLDALAADSDLLRAVAV